MALFGWGLGWKTWRGAHRVTGELGKRYSGDVGKDCDTFVRIVVSIET